MVVHRNAHRFIHHYRMLLAHFGNPSDHDFYVWERVCNFFWRSLLERAHYTLNAFGWELGKLGIGLGAKRLKHFWKLLWLTLFHSILHRLWLFHVFEAELNCAIAFLTDAIGLYTLNLLNILKHSSIKIFRLAFLSIGRLLDEVKGLGGTFGRNFILFAIRSYFLLDS